jgi:hypothetical protein
MGPPKASLFLLEGLIVNIDPRVLVGEAMQDGATTMLGSNVAVCIFRE